jgi:hypothetical protein
MKWISCALLAVFAFARIATAGNAPRILDDFHDASLWKAGGSDQVASSLRETDGPQGRALCLDYDFGKVSGYASMRRELPLTFPANYEFDFDVRGEGPPNSFEFKLIDASGENVWWVSKPSTTLPNDWTPVRYKARHISPAWGPLKDKTLRATKFLEFTLSANSGGKGSVCVANLHFRERDSAPNVWLAPKLSASSGATPKTLSKETPWLSATKPAHLTLDFGALHEFGGVILHWQPNEYASRYDIELSDDGKAWRSARHVEAGNGGDDALMLTESESRYLRIAMREGPGPRFGLIGVEVKDLAFGESTDRFVQALAKEAPRGAYPRGFSGEQSYWTVVGVDGGAQSGLLGEDGALEMSRGGFSIEPFVIDGEAGPCPSLSNQYGEQNPTDASIADWSNVQSTQTLQDDGLPMPGVRWTQAAEGRQWIHCPNAMDFSGKPHLITCGANDIGPWRLDVDAFATGDRATSQLIARYTLHNDDWRWRTFTLALAIQPFQVNPPAQFLATPGGVSPIHALGFDGNAISVNGVQRAWPLRTPTQFFATAFDQDMAMRHLTYQRLPDTQQVSDSTGLASGALMYRLEIPPHGSASVSLDIPLAGNPARAWGDADAWVTAQQEATATIWREKLDRVRLRVPPAAQPIANALRTALAHLLIERDGVQLRPGTRSYARSWIRDGAMMGEALLRLGHADAAKDFLTWFAPFQFENGKVPCCVDARGSDPVPENDSHGELLFLANEVFRYTHDIDTARRVWPQVDKAAKYIGEMLASQRIAANEGSERFGLMPPSISHEGYSAKPAYSYWDDFWTYIGLRSAAQLADALGENKAAKRIGSERADFLRTLANSASLSARHHNIDFVPGAADLGDFDATSTTIALSPGGLTRSLPDSLITNTFERYWKEFVTRRDGQREWKDYTPYEWRNVAAMLRLGWRDRALEAVKFFMADRRPAAWNGWAEVVGRDAREVRFIGDMPHGWVASDFIRSALDLFAYERQEEAAMVLAAGIPPEWLDDGGIAITDLRTPYGKLSYSLQREGRRVHLNVAKSDFVLPKGGLRFVWPGRGEPGTTRENGKVAKWEKLELAITHLPCDIFVDEETNVSAPAATSRSD